MTETSIHQGDFIDPVDSIYDRLDNIIGRLVVLQPLGKVEMPNKFPDGPRIKTIWQATVWDQEPTTGQWNEHPDLYIWPAKLQPSLDAASEAGKMVIGRLATQSGKIVMLKLGAQELQAAQTSFSLWDAQERSAPTTTRLAASAQPEPF